MRTSTETKRRAGDRPIRILALSGSLRRASWNTKLLDAMTARAPAGVTIERFDLREVPLYDGDAEAAGPIAAVEALKAAIDAADGVLVATPEYNYGIPGVLKNALDQASRPAYRSPFAGKPVAVVSASPSPYGGARAQGQVKATLLAMLAEVFPAPDLAVAAVHTRFDEQGHLADEDVAARLDRLLGDFAAALRARRAAREATARDEPGGEAGAERAA